VTSGPDSQKGGGSTRWQIADVPLPLFIDLGWLGEYCQLLVAVP